MRVPRRSVLLGGASALAAALLDVDAPASALQPAPTTLPVKDEFVVRDYEVCLNNARWHPMSRGARQAVIDYLDYKAHGVVTQQGIISPTSIAVRKGFAELIGAKSSEIAFVNSTTAGENQIGRAHV